MRKILDIIPFCKIAFIICALFFCFRATGYAADVTLQWDANTESDLAGYKVYYKTGLSGEPYNGTGATEGASPIEMALAQDENPDQGIVEFTLHGLADAVTYFFAVKAYDNETPSLESGYSNEADNKAPQITSPPTVTSIADTTATIEWNTDEPGNSVVEYNISESTDPDDVKEVSGYVTNHSVTLTNLNSNTSYRFRVSSTDEGGAGPDISGTDNNPSPATGYYTFTTEPTPDTTAPQITAPPTVTFIAEHTAVIEWQTDEPSNSQVQYDDTSGT
jgi:hypothetical protein